MANTTNICFQISVGLKSASSHALKVVRRPNKCLRLNLHIKEKIIFSDKLKFVKNNAMHRPRRLQKFISWLRGDLEGWHQMTTVCHNNEEQITKIGDSFFWAIGNSVSRRFTLYWNGFRELASRRCLLWKPTSRGREGLTPIGSTSVGPNISCTCQDPYDGISPQKRPCIPK